MKTSPVIALTEKGSKYLEKLSEEEETTYNANWFLRHILRDRDLFSIPRVEEPRIKVVDRGILGEIRFSGPNFPEHRLLWGMTDNWVRSRYKKLKKKGYIEEVGTWTADNEGRVSVEKLR